ncbi:DUF3422 domain-containing protein [Novosphingobium sp. FKTRR1]|uniref:DUF3422 domain-containing protein n=1 Tax=Novosphingobium sp. FKTRR1 TaxID=2879118 RepID=UPI001CF0618C|nr:DUF3422 domain-containing protein [Novosphingobium sp. FKTRR1]
MLQDHGLRRDIVGEMHLRRWPLIEAPLEIYQIVRLCAADAAGADSIPSFRPGGQPLVAGGNRHLSGELGADLRFTWERHSEATCLTLFAQPGTPLIGPALAWAEAMPGEVVRATQIVIVADDATAQPLVDALGYDPAEVVSCCIGGGARIWSDFRIGEQGYGRLTVAANGLHPVELGRAVQAVQELGNYRNLALLGLPVARGQWSRLDAADERLRKIGTMLEEGVATDNAMLDELCRLSLEVGSIGSATRYRLGATAAYARLVQERLEALCPTPLRGYASLTDFAQRRFTPAIRTCEAVARRQGELADRSAQLSALLRTRIETHIEDQNARLLASLESSAANQLRLQHLVEGLSSVAITYYAVALIRDLTGGLDAFGVVVNHELLLAVATPLAFLAVYLFTRRARSRLFAERKNQPR